MRAADSLTARPNERTEASDLPTLRRNEPNRRRFCLVRPPYLQPHARPFKTGETNRALAGERALTDDSDGIQ